MEKLKIPTHLAIIMDGNGRWATSRGLSRSEGHRAGATASKKLVIEAFKKGIKVVSLFAFSSENFKREDAEVNYLMDLFVIMFSNEYKEIIENDIKLVFSGRREPLPKKVLKIMDNLVEESKDNKSGILNICLNYGGHNEIVDATKRIVSEVQRGKLDINDLNEETYEKYLDNDLPPIDLLIRTSGEERVSNFMLWQMSYAEMYFPTFHFPDFDEERLNECLIEYTKRDRRFGGTKNED